MPESSEDIIGLQWFGSFYSAGGYGTEALVFAQSIQKLKIPLKIQQHGAASFNKNYSSGLPNGLLDTLNALHENDPGKHLVSVCHSQPVSWHPHKGKKGSRSARCPPQHSWYLVGRTMVETDRLPDGWAKRLNAMDQVWIPTEFSRKIFTDGGVEPELLQVVGQGVDTKYFHSEARGVEPYPLKGAKPSTFVYFSVFNWEDRKGWDILLESYFGAFTAEDNVLLVILTNKPDKCPEFKGMGATVERFAEEKGFDPEKLPGYEVLVEQSQSEVRSLYKAADAYVLPSRGEGWGRTYMEAMAMGLPVIATNWSGPTEYMTEANSYLLKTDGLVEVENGPYQGHMWANPSVMHLKELLKYVRDNPEDAQKKGKEARKDMVRAYSVDAIGHQVQNLLKNIQAEMAYHDDKSSTCNGNDCLNQSPQILLSAYLKKGNHFAGTIMLIIICLALLLLSLYAFKTLSNSKIKSKKQA
mmetsp:Transcript_11780/g.15374  ORF Transcript_11780/g.15374 Transcript_11780/m.15374 type:complete len:469 (+) Transcript_11780:22-1428(+)